VIVLKRNAVGVDTASVAAEIVASMRYLLDQVVTGIPGVTGAIVASVDGFAIADHLPSSPVGYPGLGTAAVDAAGLAAMSAAMVGVSNRMVGVVGPEPVRHVTLHSPSGYVLVHRVANVAVLTITADDHVDVERVHLVAREVANGVERLLRGALTSARAGTMQRA
jgi:predicted regulator of Ras-like GTPase activity (Roadblock/LC7/MglB family)